MTTPLDDSAVARHPTQARSRKRFAEILQGAERLLADKGLSGFSIPALAQELGLSRRSIYFFFPTPYALLNEVTRRHIGALEAHLAGQLQELAGQNVVHIGVQLVAAAAAFHNSQPVARLLILGGAVTDHSYRIQEQNILHLGELAGRIMRNFGARFPKAPPDVPTMAVELGASCFRHSYYQHGEIIEAYVVEAAYVMALYLQEALGLTAVLTRKQIREVLASAAP